MILAALPFALAVLLPVMLGPLPTGGTPATLIARLCNGGTITIPLGPHKSPADNRDCHPKGCHGGTCREDEDEDDVI